MKLELDLRNVERLFRNIDVLSLLFLITTGNESKETLVPGGRLILAA